MLELSLESIAGETRLDGSLAYREALTCNRARPPARVSPAAAFLTARRHFLAGDRIDMQALAGELGVSRQTLYRWTGSREQLLADVMFALSDAVFDTAMRETAHLGGADRLLAVFRRHVTALISSRPLATFLRNETAAALRILTARHGSFIYDGPGDVEPDVERVAAVAALLLGA